MHHLQVCASVLNTFHLPKMIRKAIAFRIFYKHYFSSQSLIWLDFSYSRR